MSAIKHHYRSRMNLQPGNLTDSGESTISAGGLDEPRLVIAIDFGTFASGYALQWNSDFQENRLKIHCNKKWNTTGLCTYKTPTSLLLSPDKTKCEFGYDAESLYTQLGCEDGEYRNEDPLKWYMFRQFKMILHNREDLSDKTPVEGVSGNHLPAIEVFSRSIEYMKNHVIGHIQSGGVPYPENETKWVLTVPAIWDETAKSLMRRAAVIAGINNKFLTIALEPECASIYCSQISEDQLKISGDNGKLKYVAAPGSTIMVVDMGGGTVDMTTIQINSDSTMKQVYRSDGGPWGGKSVDDKFFAMIRDLVTENVMLKFARTNPEEEYEMRMDFETQKRNVLHPTTKECNDRFKVKLPSTLKNLWEQNLKKNLADILKEREEDVIFSRSKLSFKMETIKNFFEETITEIERNVRQVLGAREHVGVTLDSLILVGGFAESDFVVQSLRERLKTTGIPVVRPESTELAVLNGAVLYGQNEAIMTSRILRYTYGVGMIMEFDPKIHKQENKFEDSGKLWANDVFRKHVTKGQEVKFGQWISGKTYFPVEENQKSATIYVYSSDDKDPVHITDKGCKYIGQLEIQFSTGRILDGSQVQQAVEVQFNFGGTELTVKASDKTVGKQYSAIMTLQ